MFSLIPVACESHDSPKMVKVSLYAQVIQTNKTLLKNKKKINDNDDRLSPLFSSFTLHLSACSRVCSSGNRLVTRPLFIACKVWRQTFTPACTLAGPRACTTRMKNEFDVCLYVLESFASLAIQLAATACAARNNKQPLKRLKLQIDCQTL